MANFQKERVSSITYIASYRDNKLIPLIWVKVEVNATNEIIPITTYLIKMEGDLIGVDTLFCTPILK